MKYICLILSLLLVLIVKVSSKQLNRYVITNNSYYEPYEKLFNKKPSVNFNDTYYNRYLQNSNNKIYNVTKIRVCFKNHFKSQDPRLDRYANQFKDGRTIAEYILSKLSKYTALKFWLTSKKCQMTIDLDDPELRLAGLCWFYAREGQPRANISVSAKEIKNMAKTFNISPLRAYMQILMHEILHGLGIDHSIDDTNSKSIIRSVYDYTAKQLIYKKDVYILRSIYGVQRALSVDSKKISEYTDPGVWETNLMDAVVSFEKKEKSRTGSKRKSKKKRAHNL
ncbi:uncharacterized protein LOC123305942 [Chrysoperla carnea]|uniref:uncharacterized protein LOC123305942 n=1 Tax=Chrysoperla carnea TaxID=189513 RepID=UPI001D0630CA|nr:uncharacterized protein LOC123305942 [Chrysoperla carnea]